MTGLRALDYAAHLAAAVALLAAAPRAPSLRTTARVVAAGLVLSAATGAWGRTDGRALYHLAQFAWAAWLAVVLLVAGAPPRAAAASWGAFAGAALAWWPASAALLYAGAQGLAAAAAVALLAVRLRAARAPLPGDLAALVLVVAEALVAVAPYGLAVVAGSTVAAAWEPARVVRLVEWGALAVVGWATWRSGSSSQVSGRSSWWRRGLPSRLAPRGGPPLPSSPRCGR